MADFHIRDDIFTALISAEAAAVSPFMAHIYLRLCCVPPEWQRGRGVVEIHANPKAVVPTPWMALCEHLHLMLSPDPHEAIAWLEEKQIISYETLSEENAIRISLKGLYYPADDL